MKLVLAAAVLALSALGTYVYAEVTRDIVIVRALTCGGELVTCARELHFNGDWRGVKLCRAGKCVLYQEVFHEERH